MKNLKISVLAAALAFGALVPATGAELPVYKDPAAAPAARAADLLGRMTTEEKLGQLQQLDGLWDTGAYREEFPKLAREGRLGSTLNVRTAPHANALQKEAVENSRLGVPVLFAFDVIHGYRTIFPVPLAESAQWDPALAERAAAAAAEEAYAVGLKWTFAPMVDIARDPRWGRIVEGSGEDAYLGSKLAAARVRGFQGADFAAPGRLMACAKHWAGYGAAEAGRDYNSTDISPSALRNVYFPPFKAAVDAGAATFMAAFNDLNGVPSTAHKANITGVLRGEWGFKGFVVSDYTSVKELIAHGLAANDEDAAVKALSAGVDMEMVSTLYRDKGPAALAAGRLSPADVDASALRVLEMKFRAGIFENPYIDPALEAKTLLTPEKLRLALDAALKSLVLLKNEGTLLPLDPGSRKVAVIGKLADSREDMLGSWAADGKPADAVTLLEGIKTVVSPKTRVVYSSGCYTGDASEKELKAAVAAAAGADVIIVAVGESALMSGEAASRVSLALPGRQRELLERLKKTGRPVVAVLFNGRPLELGWLDANVPAILEAWQPGTRGGLAVAQTLFGLANPGGKLPVTFPRSVGQVPIYYAQRATGRPTSLTEKYSSRYIDSSSTPLYPFGYGLSYSSFTFSNLLVSPAGIKPDGKALVSVDVKNVSARAGDEVAQLYIRDPAGSETRPLRELKGFERVTLAPGESRTLRFELTPAELGWHYAGGFAVEPGTFKVYVGSSSASGLETSFEVLP